MATQKKAVKHSSTFKVDIVQSTFNQYEITYVGGKPFRGWKPAAEQRYQRGFNMPLAWFCKKLFERITDLRLPVGEVRTATITIKLGPGGKS